MVSALGDIAIFRVSRGSDSPASMNLTIKPASACGDCNLCSRCEPRAPGDGIDIDAVVDEVLRQIRPPASTELPIGVSARHCHLTDEGLETLFGKGARLKVYRDLYQPGAFAAEEVVSVVGPRLRAIERVRVLGPTRGYNQVELARTDAIYLGLDPPIRDSGDLDGAQPITFIGPEGSFTTDCAIRATRHIHLNLEDVRRIGLTGIDRVSVRIRGEKGLVFHNVRLKIAPGQVPEIHLDTDDANAAAVACGDHALIEV